MTGPPGSNAETSIAATRFGLGARPGDLERIGTDAKGWLRRQVSRRDGCVRAMSGFPNSAEAAAIVEAYGEAIAESRRRPPPSPTSNEVAPDPQQTPPARAMREAAIRDTVARTNAVLSSDTPFADRWARFWMNHFTVSMTKPQIVPFVGPFEREAIRPFALSKFSDLLIASTRHAAMLIYLDQIHSIGPNSTVGERRDRGLNENLAREILELHTLGADGGYSQTDVTTFAKALTGWTVNAGPTRRFAPRGAASGAFIFAGQIHEPGEKTILGRRYPQTGEDQARQVLLDISVHPSTARHIAFKVARHFTSDTPPPSLVQRLETRFRETGGDLQAVANALIDAPECWLPTAEKFKTPSDFILSSLRAVGAPDASLRQLQASFAVLGETPGRAPSPKGWPDDAASWAGSDAILKRLEWANTLADQVAATRRPEDIADAALGARLSPATRLAISRAESAQQGITLFLMSPEFQRR
jgi:uncharacterized protein (DUF1800 family)